MTNKTLRQILAENLRNKRQEKSYSQENFAEYAKVNRNYPGMIERCEVNVTIQVIDNIAKALNTSVSILLGGSIIPKKKVKITTLLAQNVRKCRYDKGWSQDDLAKKGIHRAYISTVERGKNVTVDTVEKLAKALDIEPYKLFEQNTDINFEHVLECKGNWYGGWL